MTAAFFIMPAEALITLRQELAPFANDLAIRAILFRYGFRSGEACIERIGIKSTEGNLLHILPDIWDEIGLGRLTLKKRKKEGLSLQLSESIEANVLGQTGYASCDFTRGYLAGIVSTLSNKMYHCKEEKCASKGDKNCTFILTTKGEGE